MGFVLSFAQNGVDLSPSEGEIKPMKDALADANALFRMRRRFLFGTELDRRAGNRSSRLADRRSLYDGTARLARRDSGALPEARRSFALQHVAANQSERGRVERGRTEIHASDAARSQARSNAPTGRFSDVALVVA